MIREGFLKTTYFWSILLGLLVTSCHTQEHTSPTETNLTTEQQLENNLQTLRQTAQNGDLLVRLTDDIISQHVTNLNEQDKSYSHCGLIVIRNNKKYVYHIGPNLPDADTIEQIPLDTFINPQHNIRCALFRYQVAPRVLNAVIEKIENDKLQGIRFDPVYDLATEKQLYCTEMIAKAFSKATNGSMQFRTINAPKRMQKLLLIFFKKQHLSKEVIANRKFISLDNLYLRPDCKELMRFDLKIFPGQ